MVSGAGVEAAQETRVHPTAIIDRTAHLEPGVEIGTGAVVGPACVIGARTRILPRAIIAEHTVMGTDNEVHSFAVIGGDPQDRKYKPGVRGRLIVGNGNLFREGATVNRSVGDEHATRIGNRCYLMTGAHVGHDSVLGDGVTMANNSCVAGHVRVHDGAFLSACCAVHQFCTVGELAMFQFASAVSMHVPPYVVLANGVNIVAGLNRVGLQRCNRFTLAERLELKQAYRLLYRDRDKATMDRALLEAEGRQWGPAAGTFLQFVREALRELPPRRRGVCGPMRRVSRLERANGGLVGEESEE